MSDNNKATIPFVTEDGEEILFHVIEQTSIVGQQYLLVTEDEPDAEEAEVYIMKQTSVRQDDTVIYEFVEDDQELESISNVFSELLDDTDIIKQD